MRVAGVIAVVLVLAGIASIVARLAAHKPARHAMRLSLEAPRGLGTMGYQHISPDGRYIAFTAWDSTGRTYADNRIWLVPLDGSAARSLPGTTGAASLFWSPDSRHLGFSAGRKIKRVAVAGGEPVTICDAAGGDGSWGSAGIILVDATEHGVAAMSAAGGELTQAAWPDSTRGEQGCAWPQFLPDGRHFLYLAGSTSKPESVALRLGRLGSRESNVLAIGEFSRVEYASPGYVLYVKGRTLLAQPFDNRRLALAGSAIPVVEDVLRANQSGGTDFSVSRTGTLAYRDEWGEGKLRLVWMNREGREDGSVGPAGVYWGGLAVSPDRKRVAAAMVAPGEFSPDIWSIDVARNLAVRLTAEPVIDALPAWSTDGKQVFYCSMRDGRFRLRTKPASGLGEAREIPMPDGHAWSAPCATPDGRSLLVVHRRKGGNTDIVRVSLDDNPKTTPLGILGGGGPPLWGSFTLSLSRDGKWLAYDSVESGREEVYVVDYPGLTEKWRVSVDGGFMPCWSEDGRELFFLDPDRKPMMVAFLSSPKPSISRPVQVLEASPELYGFVHYPGRDTFLALVDATGEQLPPTRVILNWQASLKRR